MSVTYVHNRFRHKYKSLCTHNIGITGQHVHEPGSIKVPTYLRSLGASADSVESVSVLHSLYPPLPDPQLPLPAAPHPPERTVTYHLLRL